MNRFRRMLEKFVSRVMCLYGWHESRRGYEWPGASNITVWVCNNCDTVRIEDTEWKRV